MTGAETEFPETRELILERIIDAPRDKVWRCWAEAALLKQWFCPAPWKVSEADIDPRPGGVMRTVMQGPNGENHDNVGVYLEVIDGERIVFTDGFEPGWRPADKPFMVAIVEFSDAPDGKTAYRARARHWREEDRKTHEEMGFHPGWNAAADQLEALAKAL